MARLTPEQKQKRRAAEAAYKRAVAQSFADWNANERQYLRMIRDDLTNYENAIKASMANVTEWDAHRIDQVNAMFDDAKAKLNARLTSDYAWADFQTVQLAVDSVTKPLEAFGVHIGAAGRQLPIQQLNYLRSVVPTLITNVTADAHEQVRQLLYTHAHGGMSRADLYRKIGSAVGPLDGKAELKPGQIIPRAEARARTIFRTETNRVASLVTDNEIKKLSAVDKGVGARWVHWPSQNPRSEHVALNGKVIFPGHGEFFEVGGVKVTGPHDPSLPASEVVSCHCKALVVYDPDKADDVKDPHIAAAPSGGGSPAPTPTTVPVPKPAVKVAAPKKPRKPKAAEPAPDTGPVTVKAADVAPAGSAIPSGAPAGPARGVRPLGEARVASSLKYKDLPARPPLNASFDECRAHIEKLCKLDNQHWGQSPHFIPWDQKGFDELITRFRKYEGDKGIRAFTQLMHDAAEQARRQGIPFYNNVGMTKSAVASVGGSYFKVGTTFTSRLPKYYDRLKSAEDGIKYRDKVLSGLRASLVQESEYTASEQALFDAFRGEVRELVAKFEAWDGFGAAPEWMNYAGIRAYRPTGAESGISRWINGSRAELVGDGMPDADRVHATMWHEFGHLVHNTISYSQTGKASSLSVVVNRFGVNTVAWGGPMKRELERLNPLNRPSGDFITRYAEVGGKSYSKGREQWSNEWFAENYSAWHNGFYSHVEPSWIEFAKKWGVIS